MLTNSKIIEKYNLGKGLAKLPRKAPKTYQFLKDILKEVFKFNNEEKK